MTLFPTYKEQMGTSDSLKHYHTDSSVDVFCVSQWPMYW